MDDCLTQWHQYVDEQRSKCYELNYFTTEQLLMLRQYLAQYTNRRELPGQVNTVGAFILWLYQPCTCSSFQISTFLTKLNLKWHLPYP